MVAVVPVDESSIGRALAGLRRAGLPLWCSAELAEKLLRPLQISGVEPFREAPVGKFQETARFFSLALVSLQPSDAHRCPQLPRRRALTVVPIERSHEVLFAEARVWFVLYQQEFAFEPTRLGKGPDLLVALGAF